MMGFDVLFPELAPREARAILSRGEAGLPVGTFVFRELYCNERDCACRRVLLQVWWAERELQVATLNYSFEPAKPPFEDEPQLFLDPTNPQTELADTVKELFEQALLADTVYVARLHRHYEQWKAVVDDPSHPDHRKVRSATHDDPDHRPAFPRPQVPERRQGAKIGRNDPCPCGSGKKHKKCCG